MSLHKKCPYSGFFWSKKQTKKTPNTALSTQCVFCLLNYTYQKIEQHQNTKESKKKKKKCRIHVGNFICPIIKKNFDLIIWNYKELNIKTEC